MTFSLAFPFLAVCGTWLSADLVTLANADFEQGSPALPDVAPGGTSYAGNIPGWNVVNSGGVFEPNFVSEVSYPASVQTITGDFTAYSKSNTSGLVTQLLDAAITFQADATYVLSMDVGHRLDETFSGGFGFFRLANPFPVGMSVTTAIDPGAGNFSRQSHTLHGSDILASDLGDNFRIGFFGLPGSTVDFDNVTLDISTVPEPTGISMGMAGLLLLFWRRRRPNPAPKKDRMK